MKLRYGCTTGLSYRRYTGVETRRRLATVPQELLNMAYVFKAPLQIGKVSAARKRNDLCVWDRIGDGTEICMLMREIAVTVHRERGALNPANIILQAVQKALSQTRQTETASTMYRFLRLRNEITLVFAASW